MKDEISYSASDEMLYLIGFRQISDSNIVDLYT